MKKVWAIVAVMLVSVSLAGCSAKVTEKGLMKKDWLTTETNEGVTTGLELHFTEDTVTVTPTVVAIDIKQVPESEKTLGESFYKSELEETFKSLETTGDYTLADGTIHLKLSYGENFEDEVKMTLPKKGRLTFEKGNLVLTDDKREYVFEPIK